jgi:CheY-like chemotaxis protein
VRITLTFLVGPYQPWPEVAKRGTPDAGPGMDRHPGRGRDLPAARGAATLGGWGGPPHRRRGNHDMRVLLVAENPDERMRAGTALRLDEATEVVEAGSAREARRLLREGPAVDVLLVDGDLRPQGGFSFLYEVRASGELAGAETPPALVMIAREQDRFLSDWSGANELVLKPVDPFEVARRIRALAGDAPAPRDPADESHDQVPGEPGAPGEPASAEVPKVAGVRGASGTP